jgi:hypothetical protein
MNDLINEQSLLANGYKKVSENNDPRKIRYYEKSFHGKDKNEYLITIGIVDIECIPKGCNRYFVMNQVNVTFALGACKPCDLIFSGFELLNEVEEFARESYETITKSKYCAVDKQAHSPVIKETMGGC